MDLRTTSGYVPCFADERNLRELGGLPTADGRHVRRGLFFRGSPLFGLTADERTLIDSLGLRFILDLRAAGEANGTPDYVPSTATYRRCGGMRFDDGSEVDFSPEGITRLQRELPNIFEGGRFMEHLYVSMTFGNPAMHELVDRVAAGEVPIYFHCTAGKDRTGMGALMIGLMLDITHEAIFEDFLLTNEYRRSIIESVAERMPEGTPPEDIERWQKANGVQAETLEAVFDAIEERCGTTERYLRQEFGLDEATLATLRDRYLA